MTNGANPQFAINTFSLRPGVSREAFVAFSSEIDQPTLKAQSHVISRFDVLQILGDAEGSPLGFDFIELYEIPDWHEWAQVRDESPALDTVRSTFDALVEPSSVRCSFALPLLGP